MKTDIEERRVKNMKNQKEAFLRVNLERMLMGEALKLRPEIRQNSSMINRIEALIDLPRIRRLLKEPLCNKKVRLVATQAESVFISA